MENLNIKIADFGLSRQLHYFDGYYKKVTTGKLPAKWMAPESLDDNTYYLSSDVWSFGIVLWEIETFGQSPYPSVENISHLSRYLRKGYRMKQPPNCSYEM